MEQISYDPRESRLHFLDRNKYVVSIEKSRYKELPANDRKLASEKIDENNRMPMKCHVMAHHEEGIRQACALPYELYADGMTTQDGAHWELRLTAGNQVHGIASAGVPFNVYMRGRDVDQGLQVATFAVKADDTIVRKFPIDVFNGEENSIEVHGPNGFYRSFSGRIVSQSAVNVYATYERNASGLTGNLQIHLDNISRKSVVAMIADQVYGATEIRKQLDPGEAAELVLPPHSSSGWYDVLVTVESSVASVRYAGHVDTGSPGISDPLMGGLS